MKMLWILPLLPIAAALGLLAAGQMGFLAGTPRSTPGVVDGRLAPPSQTPNSVSSQARLYPGHPQHDYATIAPLAFHGDGAAAMQQLTGLLEHTPRTIVVTRRSDYLYAQSSTALLGFTDDLEFWLDRPNQVIQVRSASRLGGKDFGVNRARVEALRARFEQVNASAGQLPPKP